MLLQRQEVLNVAKEAGNVPLQRSRICAHSSLQDPIHEMFIAFTDKTYVRPHRHIGKVESYHVIEGVVSIFQFDATGAVESSTLLGTFFSDLPFYYRLVDSGWHSLVCISPSAIIHEVTSGPFRPEDTLFAEWAPKPDRFDDAEEFVRRLKLSALKRVV